MCFHVSAASVCIYILLYIYFMFFICKGMYINVVSLQARRWWTGWCSCSWLWPVWRPWRWPRPCWRRVSYGLLAWRVWRLCAPPASASSSWTTPLHSTASWVSESSGVLTSSILKLDKTTWRKSAYSGVVLNAQRIYVHVQSESLKKRGSVKAETSLSAVEMSGKVIKRGYLLKQVNTLN